MNNFISSSRNIPDAPETSFFDWPLPDGGVCRVAAADPIAAAAYRRLAGCGGMRPGRGECDYRIDAAGFSGTRPADFIGLHGCRVIFSWRPETAELRLILGDPEQLDPVRRGVQLRQLFFLCVLPALWNARAFVVHGALAAVDGHCIALCGPSGIGKSTAAAKLPEDFEVLADDCFLISRRDGRWMAQGVPTWSIWISGKPERRFDCGRIFPLERIYLLERGSDAILPLEGAARTLALVPSFSDMLNWYMSVYPAEMKAHLQRLGFAAAAEIAGSLPFSRVRCNLATDFSMLRTGSRA